jgi:hypothetical protein
MTTTEPTTRDLRHATHNKIHEIAKAVELAHYKICGKPGLLKYQQVERLDLVIATLLTVKELADDAIASAQAAKVISEARDFDAYKAEKDAAEALAQAEAEAAEALAVEAAKLFFTDEDEEQD